MLVRVECISLLVLRWKLYGDQVAAVNSQFSASLGKSQAGNVATTNIDWHNW